MKILSNYSVALWATRSRACPHWPCHTRAMRSLSLFLLLACGQTVGGETSESTLVSSGASEARVSNLEESRPSCFPEWARGAALSMSVRSQGGRRMSAAGVERTHGNWDMGATFRLRTRLDANGTSIEQSNFSGWRGDALAPITFAALYVLHRIRGLRIDEHGVVVGIEGAVEAKAEAEAVFATREGVPAGAQLTWDMASTPEGLRAQAAQWWQLFSILSCADLSQWTTHTEVSNDSGWIHNMENVRVAIDASVVPVPCPAGGQGCERRTLSLRPDGGQTLAALHQQMAAIGRTDVDSIVGFSILRQPSGVFDAEGNPTELSMLKETTTVHSRPGIDGAITQVGSEKSTYRFAPTPGPTI